MPSSLPRFSARRSAAFGANGFPSAARNRLDSVSERVATDSAATVLSASRNTADRTNAASGNPANAAARSIRSRSLVDRRRSRRAVAVIEKLQLEDCTVLYRTACIVLGKYEYVAELSPNAAGRCLPLACGGIFGLLGGYLTDLLGRRRVLVWSILLYALSACAASLAISLPQLLFFRCTTVVGVCVEYVAWVAELFSNPKQRESVLGYTQAAIGLGGLMVTAAYFVAVTYADRFPAIHGSREAWRYTLLSGLIPAIPLILVRPFLPASPIWQERKSNGTLQRPSFAELFRPALRKTTLITTFLVACSCFKRSALLQAACLVVRIATQRRLLRVFLIPGLMVFSCVYFYAATHSLLLLECGMLFAGLLMNGPFRLWGNYLPRVYPTHLRGIGESFAINIGGRVIGASGVLLTTQLTNVMPGASAAARLAYSAGTLAVLAYCLSLIGSHWLREPNHAQLPD
jgi:MFS family permease